MTRNTFINLLKRKIKPRLDDLGFRPVIGSSYFFKIELGSEEWECCYCGFIAATKGAKQELTCYCINIADSAGNDFFNVEEYTQPITEEQIINNFNKVEAFLLED